MEIYLVCWIVSYAGKWASIIAATVLWGWGAGAIALLIMIFTTANIAASELLNDEKKDRE